jgi:hypothetical protein
MKNSGEEKEVETLKEIKGGGPTKPRDLSH